MREILVAIHAAAGVAGILVGLPVFNPPDSPGHRHWWRLSYLALLATMAASLLVLVVLDWPDLETGARVAFSGLSALGLVIVARARLALGLARTREPGWEGRYVSHVYFTYVSLWVGFAILPAIRSSNPGLWIPVSVVTVLAIGTLLVHRYEKAIGLRSTG